MSDLLDRAMPEDPRQAARRLGAAGRDALTQFQAQQKKAARGPSEKSLKEWLAAYRNALGELAAGSVAEVSLYRRDLNRTVRYDRTMLPALRQQIALLETALGLEPSMPVSRPKRRWA